MVNFTKTKMVNFTETKERYIINQKPESFSASRGYTLDWYEVTREEFARAECDALAGTTEELISAIAAKEDVPDSFINDNGHGYGFTLSSYDLGQISTVLDWTQRAGKKIAARYGATLKALQKALPGRKVFCINYHHYIVDRKWILESGQAEYNPAEAEERIARREEGLAHAKAIEGVPKKRSKIPWRGVLGTISHKIFEVVTDLPEFDLDYPRHRSWRRHKMIASHWPSTNEQAIWVIPKIAEFYWKLTRNKNYRTADFMAAVKLCAKKHLDDIKVTPQFKAFILEESRARVAKIHRNKKEKT